MRHTSAYQPLVASHYLQAAGLDHPAGTLYALPLLNIPASQLDLALDWDLPGGRSPDNHHLFPVGVPAEGRQGPITLVDNYKSSALHVSMQAVIGAPCISLRIGVPATALPCSLHVIATCTAVLRLLWVCKTSALHAKAVFTALILLRCQHVGSKPSSPRCSIMLGSGPVL